MGAADRGARGGRPPRARARPARLRRQRARRRRPSTTSSSRLGCSTALRPSSAARSAAGSRSSWRGAKPELVTKLVLVAPGLASTEWSKEAQAGFAEEEALIESGDLTGAGEQQARMWLAPDAADDVRELTVAMTVRSYDQQLPFEDEVRAVWPEPSAETRLAELDVPTLLVVGDTDLPELQLARRTAGTRAARRRPRDDRGRRPSAEPRAAGRAQPATARVPPVAHPRAPATRTRPTGRTRRRRQQRATSRRSGSIQRNVAVPGFEPKWP